MEAGNKISERIRNQLRIHWSWLKNEPDYNKVADFIDSCIRQALSTDETKIKMDYSGIDLKC